MITVRWKRRGTLFVNGLAYPRNRGDVDKISERGLKRLVLSGYVDIISYNAVKIEGIKDDDNNTDGY